MSSTGENDKGTVEPKKEADSTTVEKEVEKSND